MSASSHHRDRRQPQPLRRPTRAESARARKELRGWRTRKLGVILAAMPVVVVAGVGIAMAAPRHHHQQQMPTAAACASSSAMGAANTSAAAGANGTGTANNGAANNGTANNGGAANNGGNANGSSNNAAYGYGDGYSSGSAEHMTTLQDHYRHSPSPSAAANNGGAAATMSAAAGAANNGIGMGAATSSAAAAAGTTTSAAACPTKTAAANTTTTAAAAAPAATPNPNCTLIVPANPLSAQGLATPYQLTATNAAMGPCHEANANQSAFVEAAIVNNGQVTLYDPLVIDKGTQPAAPTVPANVPAGSTVGIWFGFNGTNLTLQSANGTNALAQGNCVNGMGASIFGQFAYCNAPAFFQSANAAIQGGMLTVPPVGTAKDGLPCPTTRDFSLVDQDQSDNVVTHYLANANGQTAQMNAANMAAIPNAVDLANGSDNLLLNKFVDPALGCTPFTVPDQSSDNQPSGALPLDELSAAANQQAPIAMVPLNDPMTLNNANQDAAKVNLYRMGVDQAPIGQGGDNGSGATYCQNLFGTPQGIMRVFNDMAIFQNAPSVDAAMASNLFTFLGMRANQSFTNLGCMNLLNKPNPIALAMTGNVVTNAVMVPLGQKPPNLGVAAAAGANGTAATATPTPMPSVTTTRQPKKVHW